MFDHLIERFDLGVHYGVPAGSPDERTALHGILQERVTVDLRETEMISVRVLDQDRALAAAMANDIFETTVAIVREDRKADLERQLHVFGQVLDSTRRAASERGAELVRLAEVARSTRGERPGAGGAEEALLSAASAVALANQELVQQRRERATLLALLDQPGGEAIQMGSRAMEDIQTYPLFQTILGIVLITVGAGLVSALMLVLIIENWFSLGPQTAALRR